MKIELTVIEDLGIKLYGKLPPVISESIANSWDADASNVEITLPTGDISEDSIITIRDDGNGMSRDNIVDKYLRIGRKKRDEGDSTTSNGREVMGRKGIGKLSVFGVANNVIITTIKHGKMNKFKMNIDDIITDAQKNGVYEPEEMITDKIVDEKSSTTIELGGLKRKTKIVQNTIKRDIAKFFSVIGDDFKVSVNGDEISTSDKFQQSDMEKIWNIVNESVDEQSRWIVSGWIGAMPTTLDDEDRGLTVMARGKLIQSPTMFGVKSGEKYSYSYIMGVINAEFMDDAEDLIATNRQSIIWDEPPGEALKEWCAKKLRETSSELTRLRKDKRENILRADPNIGPWLKKLSRPEQTIANKVIKIITSSNRLDDERMKELATYMMISFEQKVFREMVSNMDEHPEPDMLIEMFETWDIIEAKEIHNIVKGRMDTIKQLEKLVNENAKEVPTLHSFFVKWPWIIEPTWTRWQSEVSYSDMLRKEYPETLEEHDRRIDFVAIGTGNTINIIELKRPDYKIRSKDLDQLTDYVEFVREQFGTHGTYNDVVGYLIAGDIHQDRVTKKRIKESKQSRRYIMKYVDLLSNAKIINQEFENKLQLFNTEIRG